MPNKKADKSRRSFLKGAGSLSLALAAGLPLLGASSVTANAVGAESSHIPIANSQLFHMKVRGSLYDPPADVDVYPGVLSQPLRLQSKGTVRVKIELAGTDPKFGPFYLVTITDYAGKPLGSMKIGSNTTATFQNLGLQVYLLSVQHAS